MTTGGDPLAMDVRPAADEPGPENEGHDGTHSWWSRLGAAVVVVVLGAGAATVLDSDDEQVRLATPSGGIEQLDETPTTPPATRWALELDADEHLAGVEVIGDLVVAMTNEMTGDRAGHTRVLALDQTTGDPAWEYGLDWEAPSWVTAAARAGAFDQVAQLASPMVHVLADDEVVTLGRHDSALERQPGAAGWQPEVGLEAATGTPRWERPPVDTGQPERTTRWAHPDQRRSVTVTFGSPRHGPSDVVDLASGEVVFHHDGLVESLGADTWLAATLEDERHVAVLLDADGTERTRFPMAGMVGSAVAVVEDSDGDIVVVGDPDELRGLDLDGRELWSVSLVDLDAVGSQPTMWSLGDGRVLLAMVDWRSEPELQYVAFVSRDGAEPMADSGLVDVPGVTDFAAVLGLGEPRLLCTNQSSNATGCLAQVALLGVDGQVRAGTEEPAETPLTTNETTPGHPTRAGLLRIERLGGDRHLVLRDWHTLDVTWQLDISTLGWTPDMLIDSNERGIAMATSRPGDQAGPVVAWAS